LTRACSWATQENKPIGTSILQLSVVDQDSSHNGPPFDFRILTGNEGGEFVLEKDGTLVANQVFRRDLAPQYVIQIQVGNKHRMQTTCKCVRKGGWGLLIVPIMRSCFHLDLSLR
jgi:hypothetical protein